METLLKFKTGAPGDGIYTANEIVSVYDSFGLQGEFVEKVAPKRNVNLTPAEMPGNEEERMTFIHQYVLAMLDEEDTEDDEDLDEDLDDEIDEADLTEDDVDEVDDADLDDEDLDLDDEDDEEEDEVV